MTHAKLLAGLSALAVAAQPCSVFAQAKIVNAPPSADDKAAPQPTTTLRFDHLGYRDGLIHATLAVNNRTHSFVRAVEVECEFFRNGKLIGAKTALLNIASGGTTHKEVLSANNTPPDRGSCRIVSIK
jgi:hypothetical protein